MFKNHQYNIIAISYESKIDVIMLLKGYVATAVITTLGLLAIL